MIKAMVEPVVPTTHAIGRFECCIDLTV